MLLSVKEKAYAVIDYIKSKAEATDAESIALSIFIGGIWIVTRNIMRNYSDPSILAIDKVILREYVILFFSFLFLKVGRDWLRNRGEISNRAYEVTVERRKLENERASLKLDHYRVQLSLVKTQIVTLQTLVGKDSEISPEEITKLQAALEELQQQCEDTVELNLGFNPDPSSNC